MRKVLLLALLMPLFTGCLKDESVDYEARDEKLISELVEGNANIIKDETSGLYYEIIEQGTGEPVGVKDDEDDLITFSYKGTYLDGKEYNDTEDENITNYLSTLPYGFQIGLSKINRLGEIKLYIPTLLTYNPYGGCAGPGDEAMIYTVKVDRDQKDIDHDILLEYFEDNSIDAVSHESGLFYVISEEGTDGYVPENSRVHVSYIGKVLGETDEFDSGTIENRSLVDLIEAWRVGLPLFRKGTKVKLYCPSQMCYGSSAVGEDIPANSILVFDLDIIDYI